MKQKYKLAYMDNACRFGETSEAARLKVGAYIVKDGRIIAQGVNGQPPGWPTEECEDEQGNTLPTVRHAEIAALEKLWQSPETAEGASMFVSHMPCEMCAIKILTAGIKEVYYRYPYRCENGVNFLKSKGVHVEQLNPV